jgi:hypothetical protein
MKELTSTISKFTDFRKNDYLKIRISSPRMQFIC